MRSPLLALALALPLGAASLSAGAATTGPAVAHAWARPTMGAMGMSAVYLDIHGGAAPDRLLGASTPAATLALHRTESMGAMTGMRPAGPIEVPAHGDVSLAPGGLHLMLTGARRPLKVGDRLPLTLRFARAGAVSVVAEVRATPPAR